MNDAIETQFAQLCEQQGFQSGMLADSILFPDYPAEEYHSDSGALSCSMLKPLLVSPAHFRLSLFREPRPSPARDFGTLMHLLLLEPQKISSHICVYPGAGDGRDKVYKEYLDDHRDRLVFDEPTFARALLLAEKVRETTYQGRPLGRFLEESLCEATIYFTEPVTQLRLRTRLDAHHPDLTFDLKTTRHALAAAFSRDAVDLHYDMQAAMYTIARRCLEGGGGKPFVFISAESAAPYSVCTFEAGSTFLENGVAKFESCLAAFKACSAANHWPDLSGHGTLEIAPWQQFSLHRPWCQQDATAVFKSACGSC